MRAFRERRRRVVVLPHSVMAISDRQLVHPLSVHPVSLMLFGNVCPADPAETRKTSANLPYALLRSKPVFLPVVSVIPIRLALAMDAASMGRVTMSASPVQAAMERKLARPLSALPVRPLQIAIAPISWLMSSSFRILSERRLRLLPRLEPRSSMCE